MPDTLNAFSLNLTFHLLHYVNLSFYLSARMFQARRAEEEEARTTA